MSRRDGLVKEAVHVARFIPQTRLQEADSILVQRAGGSTVPVYLAWRCQPHGGRSLLLRCWQCQKPSRALYGVRVGNDGRYYVARPADWECRRCAGLRFSSEGGALLIRGGRLMTRYFGHPWPTVASPRPERWLPFMFSSLNQARDSLTSFAE